jgi:hypothetical protein
VGSSTYTANPGALILTFLHSRLSQSISYARTQPPVFFCSIFIRVHAPALCEGSPQPLVRASHYRRVALLALRRGCEEFYGAGEVSRAAHRSLQALRQTHLLAPHPPTLWVRVVTSKQKTKTETGWLG